MSNAEVSRILRDLASEMERRPPESVAAVETPSTSAPTLARHPVDGSYATETLFTPPVNRTDLRYDLATGAEVCRIFAPYAGRTPGNRNRCTTTARRRSSYTRSYFCLDNTDQMVVPTRGEKETLNAAGLGEQRLTFLGDEDSAEEFKCHILTAYPKLNDCGGFEILKVSGMTRSKKLSVMPCPSTGYTIKSIKNHIKSATIYIRPMQKDIDTTPVEPESVVSGPKEKCLICAEEIFFSELKDHVKHCRSASEISRASPNMSPPDSQEFCYIASVSTSNSFEVDIDQSSTDAATLQRIDLTEESQCWSPWMNGDPYVLSRIKSTRSLCLQTKKSMTCRRNPLKWRKDAKRPYMRGSCEWLVFLRQPMVYPSDLNTPVVLPEQDDLFYLNPFRFVEGFNNPWTPPGDEGNTRISFRHQGTHAREIENRTICFWRDWLIDVEEGECAPLTLENVLEFASGSSTIPPNGFLLQPTIEILPEESGKIFPEANTCNIVTDCQSTKTMSHSKHKCAMPFFGHQLLV
ncbi:unnamed protein product [Boreogadus saida]